MIFAHGKKVFTRRKGQRLLIDLEAAVKEANERVKQMGGLVIAVRHGGHNLIRQRGAKTEACVIAVKQDHPPVVWGGQIDAWNATSQDVVREILGREFLPIVDPDASEERHEHALASLEQLYLAAVLKA